MNQNQRPVAEFEISVRDLAALGVNQVAYVRPVRVDSELRYAVHAADGSNVTVFPSLELARIAIRQNNLEPVSVH